MSGFGPGDPGSNPGRAIIMRCKIYVLTGAPCTGKTSVLNELEKREYAVLDEGTNNASLNLNEGGDTDEFDLAVFNFRKKKIEEISKVEGLFFSDRGIGDTLAYYRLKGFQISQHILHFSNSVNYAGVFIFEPLGIYESNEFRQAPKEKQQEIQEEIVRAYREMGCQLFFVPPLSIEERVSFILDKAKP